MTHINEQRLMELALGAITQSSEDAEHLRTCEQCRTALAAETDFSLTLQAIPVEPAPTFLAARIEEAYAVAMAQRAPSRAPVFALAVTLLALLPLSVVMIGHWTDVLASLSAIAVVARVFISLVVRQGWAPLMLAAHVAMLLSGTAIVMRLLRATTLATESTQ